MVIGLIPEEEERMLFEKLIKYYKKLYPGLSFKKKEMKLTPKDIGELYYTYPGEEVQATTKEKVRMIKEALAYNYKTPVILLKKKKKTMILDGHRRMKVAFSQGLSWNALAIIPSKDVEFGIESMIMGKIKALFKK